MSCGVGRRHGSDPVLLWLWCRPAATTPVQPLTWESPCASGAALIQPLAQGLPYAAGAFCKKMQKKKVFFLIILPLSVVYWCI